MNLWCVGGGTGLGFRGGRCDDSKTTFSGLCRFAAAMSGIDASRGTTVNTPHVYVGALSIFTGILEADAVCSRWAGSSPLRERFVNSSSRGDPALPPSTGRSGLTKLDETSRPRAPVEELNVDGLLT